MTAATADRPIQRKGDEALIDVIRVPLGANKKVYAGTLVVVDGTTGLGEAGTTATSKRIMGVAIRGAGATSGQSAGAVEVEVRRGAFLLAVDPADPPLQADVGNTVYILDDLTVAKTSTGKSAAGTLLEVPISTDPLYPFVLVQVSGPAMP